MFRAGERSRRLLIPKHDGCRSPADIPLWPNLIFPVARFENMPAGVLFRLCEGFRRGRTPPMFCCAELTSFTRAEGRMVNYHRPALGNTGD
jgi:hypothetical protein